MPRFLRRRAILAALMTVTVAAAGIGANLHGALTRVSPYLTRAEAAAILLLSSPAPLPTPSTNHPYTDVLPTDWFAPTMLAAAKLGILSPDETGTKLRPFGSVNRATFVKMLSQSFGLPVHQRHPFTDVPKNAWYAPYVGTEATYRMFAHHDPATFEPHRLVTQDEATIALQVFMQLRSKAEEEEAKKTAVAQASGQVQLYTVISTKKLRVLLGTEDRTKPLPLAAPRQSSARPPIAVRSSSSFAPRAAAARTEIPPKTIDDLRSEVLALVNRARANEGLPSLARNAALERSAQAYAEQMNRENFFGHTDPAGKTLQDRVDVTGYYGSPMSPDCRCITSYALGENLARGQRTPDEVVRAWLDSPSHRDAILAPDFTDLGIGIASGTWVQHFGGLVTPEAK